MSRHDSQLDHMIREALSREEAEVFDRLGNPSLAELIADTFRGKLRWFAFGSWVANLVFVALAVACLLQFFRAEELPMMLRWALGFGCCMATVIAVKIWYWMELNRNATAREIKRLELEIARLATELREHREHSA